MSAAVIQVAFGTSGLPESWELRFTAKDAGATVSLVPKGSPSDIHLQVSYNGTQWVDYSPGVDTVIFDNVGDFVLFRAAPGVINQTGFSESDYYTFSCTGEMYVTGDVQSLTSSDRGYDEALSYFHYYSLFYKNKSILSLPKLSSTKLNEFCYTDMFRECTKLTAIDLVLPATEIFQQSYRSMFQDCYNLVSVPSNMLKVERFASGAGCYKMFYDCKSLTEAPDLLPETLGGDCYREMFGGCESLRKVSVRFTDWAMVDGDLTGTNGWMSDSPSYDGPTRNAGEFICPRSLGTNDSILRGTSACPEGWTVTNI